MKFVDEYRREEDIQRLAAFWKSLGSKVVRITPDEHDRAETAEHAEDEVVRDLRRREGGHVETRGKLEDRLVRAAHRRIIVATSRPPRVGTR